jgi:transposase
MSLPAFSTQTELFSTAALSGSLFAETDRYRLFALKVYPALARGRAKLEACYCVDNGRLAIEPVLLLGVSLLQYLEGVPDRQAVDCVRESLRLALGELAEQIPSAARPGRWPQFWERYVDSQADYRAPLETLARKMVEAAAEGRELIGPAARVANHNGGRFTSEAFQVQVEQRQAICPAGKANTQCSRWEEKATGRVSYRFDWDTATGAACSMRQPCIQADHPHRALVVGEHHTTLPARRQEQQTKPFQQRMKHRNAIEGTQSELVRAHGLRHARYRGLAKARLQNYFIGAACNIKRWLRRTAWGLQNNLTVARRIAPAL